MGESDTQHCVNDCKHPWRRRLFPNCNPNPSFTYVYGCMVQDAAPSTWHKIHKKDFDKFLFGLRCLVNRISAYDEFWKRILQLSGSGWAWLVTQDTQYCVMRPKKPGMLANYVSTLTGRKIFQFWCDHSSMIFTWLVSKLLQRCLLTKGDYIPNLKKIVQLKLRIKIVPLRHSWDTSQQTFVFFLGSFSSFSLTFKKIAPTYKLVL